MPDTYELELPDGRVLEFDSLADMQAVAKTLASKAEPPLTRERQPAGTPSAMEQMAQDRVSPFSALFGQAGAGVGKAALPVAQAAVDPENLPTVGGILGGVVGGGLTGGALAIPAAAAGSALGGALGAGGRAMARSANGAPEPTAGELARDIGTEGALQGASQLAGGVISKGAGLAGRGLVNLALRPGKLGTKFPGLAETAIREGVPVTRKGTMAAEQLRNQSAADVDAIIQAANASAPKVLPQEVMPAFKPAFNTLRQQADAELPIGDQIPDMLRRARATAGSFGGRPGVAGGIDLATAQTRKKTLQDAAQGAYNARSAGNVVNDVDLKLNEGLAAGYQKAIEQRVPAAAAGNQHTQRLIGLAKALKQAESRPLLSQYMLTSAATTAAGGAGLMSGDPQKAAQHALAAAVLTSPGNLSRAGILLGRAGGGSGQIPASTLRAIMDAARQDEQQPPPPSLDALGQAILRQRANQGGR